MRVVYVSIDRNMENRFLVRDIVGPTDIRQKKIDPSAMQTTSLLRDARGKLSSYLRNAKKEIPYIMEDQSIIEMENEFRKRVQDGPEGFDDFLKKLITQKVNIAGQKKKIETFSASVTEVRPLLRFPDWIGQSPESKFIVPNIFQTKDFEYDPDSTQLLTLKKMLKARYFNNNARKQSTTLYTLLNTTFYHQINMALPSIGHLYLPNVVTEDNNSSITDMILRICNGDSNIVEYIPLHGRHNLKEDLTKLVLKKGTKNEDFKKRLMENVFQNIEITYDMVMKEGSTFKKEFIIPYKVLKSSTANGKTEIKYDRAGLIFTSAKDILKENRNKMMEAWANRTLPNAKEVLGLFAYVAIQLFYEIYHLYFRKIIDVLYEYNEDARFQEDNIPMGIAYMEKCIQSLIHFKKILHNNFFDFFLPSKISRAYGIKRDEHGFIVPASRFVVDDETLEKKYPFQSFQTSESEQKLLEITPTSRMYVNNLLVGKRRTHDLYDEKEPLAIGFYLPNQKKMEDLFDFYRHYLQVLKAQFSFQIFLYNTMSHVLLQKVPVELLFSFQAKLDGIQDANAKESTKIQSVLMDYFKAMNKSHKRLRAVQEKLEEKSNYGKSGRELREKEENLLIANHAYIMAECMREMIQHHKGLPREAKRILQEKIRVIQRKFDRMGV
jgi:hypothetical protein